VDDLLTIVKARQSSINSKIQLLNKQLTEFKFKGGGNILGRSPKLVTKGLGSKHSSNNDMFDSDEAISPNSLLKSPNFVSRIMKSLSPTVSNSSRQSKLEDS